MTSRIISVTFDASDPVRLASFWATALRWDIDDSDEFEIDAVPTDETPFYIAFLPSSQEKMGQNRVHLDLTTSSLEDQHETVRQLIALGARHIDIGQGPGEPHVVLADPEGNEFCVIEPTNTFLASCGRLGAVNCDGTKETGHFWSAALGWPLVWDHHEETAIRAPNETGPMITWSGPPLIEKRAKNRIHLDVAPDHADQRLEADRLISLGAVPAEIGQGDVSWIVMSDPDDNEFCLLTPR
jgi:predicted enzyme related to lactoylglutathione lyase